MATFDAAWCLAELNFACTRPATDEITDVTKYRYLSVGQRNVIADIASRAPWVLYGAPTALVTADNKVFTFGTDTNGYAVFPIGKVKLYTSLSSVADNPLREGYDYLQEGNQVRIPNNGTYSSTLYWRGITPPVDIDATHQPVLMPPDARQLIVLDAARRFQRDQGRRDDANSLLTDYALAFAKYMLVYKTQYRSGGALGSVSGGQFIDNIASRIDVSGYPYASL